MSISCIQDTLSSRALGRVRARAKVSCIQEHKGFEWKDPSGGILVEGSKQRDSSGRIRMELNPSVMNRAEES